MRDARGLAETRIKLELRGVGKRYTSETAAVSGLSCRLEGGRFTVVLGPSGCGKTTMLRLIAGLLRPDEGEILLDGRVIASPRNMVPPEERQMALVFQSYALWPHMAVFDNVAYGLRIRNVPLPDLRRRVEEALELVRLPGLGGRYPSELSGGQQQRVALARALVVQPAVLLLDEPLSNLDAALREEMRFELKELQCRLGLTTLYVTHDQSEALILADRVLVMHGGRIAQEGTPEELYRRPASPLVASFLGVTNFVAGTLVAVDGSRGTVMTSGGVRLTGTIPQEQREGLREASPVLLAIRPSEILLHVQEPAGVPNALAGTVNGRAFLGDYVEYSFASPAGTLRVRASCGTSVSAEAPVWATFPIGAAMVLPADGSEALATPGRATERPRPVDGPTAAGAAPSRQR